MRRIWGSSTGGAACERLAHRRAGATPRRGLRPQKAREQQRRVPNVHTIIVAVVLLQRRVQRVAREGPPRRHVHLSRRRRALGTGSQCLRLPKHARQRGLGGSAGGRHAQPVQVAAPRRRGWAMKELRREGRRAAVRSDGCERTLHMWRQCEGRRRWRLLRGGQPRRRRSSMRLRGCARWRRRRTVDHHHAARGVGDAGRAAAADAAQHIRRCGALGRPGCRLRRCVRRAHVAIKQHGAQGRRRVVAAGWQLERGGGWGQLGCAGREDVRGGRVTRDGLPRAGRRRSRNRPLPRRRGLRRGSQHHTAPHVDRVGGGAPHARRTNGRRRVRALPCGPHDRVVVRVTRCGGAEWGRRTARAGPVYIPIDRGGRTAVAFLPTRCRGRGSGQGNGRQLRGERRRRRQLGE